MPMRAVRLAVRHWQLTLISVLVIALAAVMSLALIDNAREDAERRDFRAAQDDQFCEAIPNVAEASAQALVDILVADYVRRGVPEARIANTRRLGALYIARARELALVDLPSCPKTIEEAP